MSPDPGSKAAGYLLRRHLDPESAVQAIHRNIEPLNLIYYFGREETAYYDLLLEDTRLRFDEEKHRMDVVICEPEQIAFVEASGEFVPRIAVWSEGEPRLWIYVRRCSRAQPGL